MVTKLDKVLVVDDSGLVHKMYQIFLRKYRGCVMVSASNGREALDRLAMMSDIDLILLDINMPVMNGIQFLKTLRDMGKYAHIPIIVISTEGREEDTRRGLSLGAKGYLVKPFNAMDLHTLIGRIFNDHGAPNRPTATRPAEKDVGI